MRSLQAQAEAEQQAAAAPTEFGRYRDDPAGFGEEIFGLRFWSGQRRVLDGVCRNPRTATRSGHKTGKTLDLAVLAWWWCCTRAVGRVILMAPTGRQVKKLAWRDVRRLWRVAKARGFRLPEPALAPDTGVQWPDGREIIGFSTDDAENIGGFSGAELLFLVDEASGVKQEIFDALQGNLAGGAWFALFGNPTQNSGQFFDCFHSERSGWQRFHLSSEECAAENVGDARIDGLAVQSWVDDRRRVWGTQDPRYQVRVAGDFARSSTNTVVSLGALEAAYQRHGSVDPSRDLTIGVDVARFGDDDSVVRPVLGLVALPAMQVSGYDSIEVAALVKQTVLAKRQPGGRVSIRIDAGGGYGGGVADQLRSWRDDGSLGEFVELLEVSPSEAADDPDQHYRKRDQLWFGIRDWLEAGGSIDKDAEPPELEEDLLAPTYGFNRANGAMKVEGKDEIKKRIGRSPDQGDALALAVMATPSTLDGSADIDSFIAVDHYFEDEAYGFG